MRGSPVESAAMFASAMESDAVVDEALWLGEPWRREVVKCTLRSLVWHERSYCDVRGLAAFSTTSRV
jgi:hypothetical protein